jgi:hypothetical protein
MIWEMDVMGAKDQSWTGVSTTALMYEWPAEQREAMLKMEAGGVRGNARLLTAFLRRRMIAA